MDASNASKINKIKGYSLRYMILSMENRDNKDDRSCGGIFYDLVPKLQPLVSQNLFSRCSLCL
jgi:hypothetical protein